MSHVICIAGESGTGKTTSMRKLDPDTTLYIDCDKKGLSWKGWKADFNGANKNYLVTDFPQVALNALRKVNEQENMKHIKVVVVDTINGLMVADEMRRAKEKGYDKWQDLAQSIYDLIDYSLTMRDDVTIVFVAHTQNDEMAAEFAKEIGEHYPKARTVYGEPLSLSIACHIGPGSLAIAMSKKIDIEAERKRYGL